MCEYKFHNGERCKEKALPNSKYCVLHIDLPEDKETFMTHGDTHEHKNNKIFSYQSEEFKRINKLKKEKVEEKVNKRDFNFEGAKLLEVDFSGMKIEHSVNFEDAVIIRDARFNGAEIDGDVWFVGAEIRGSARFEGAEIRGNAQFEKAKIGEAAWFGGAEIRGAAWFGGAEIGEAAWFRRAKVGGDVWFVGAKIGEVAEFEEAEIGGNAHFEEAEIGEAAWFNPIEIKRELIFKNTKFINPTAQEEACRKAKRICEDLGNRVEADYYFYREMEAKRKQKYKTFSLKPFLKLMRKLGLEKRIRNHIIFLEKERRIYWGFLELPVQYIFGYGVYPWRVIATWLLTVFSLAFVYWLGNGVEAADSLVEYIYFSVVTAATPGYGGYRPNPGFYQGLASFEAIFGTFMWAAFIATFARKYMR